MRAAVIRRYGPPDVLRVEEVPPPPPPGPRDLLVRVRAASVNPVDCKIRGGGQRALIRLKLPAILGLDVSGVVEAVGPEVTRFAPGDAVFASPTHRRPGTYAEYLLIDEREAAPKPARLSHVEAASVPLVALTAWNCLVDGIGLAPGERILVHGGTGGVGSVAVQLARHLGAEVTATCSTRNVERVRVLGAQNVVDYTREAFDAAPDAFDAVVDGLGGEVQRRSLRALRRGGRLSTLVTGLPEASKRFGPYLAVLVVAAGMLRRSLGARLRGRRVHHALRRSDGALLERLGALYDAGTLRPVVDRAMPLEAVAEAHRYVETGHARGKVVLTLDDEGDGGSGDQTRPHAD